MTNARYVYTCDFLQDIVAVQLGFGGHAYSSSSSRALSVELGGLVVIRGVEPIGSKALRNGAVVLSAAMSPSSC